MLRKILLFYIILLIVSNMLTFGLTRQIYLDSGSDSKPPQTSETPDPAVREELRHFVEILDILSERYVDQVTAEELIEAAIKGMVDSLGDPQTSFLDPQSWEEMKIRIDGSFSGIGIEVNSVDDYITVIAPIRNTPAERAGLLPGDRIVSVDDQNITGISVMDAVKLLRGPEGTRVTVSIRRDGVAELLVFELVRSNIVLPTVEAAMKENRIGYIEIFSFAENTGADFSAALLELEVEGMAGLILDLRDNPGGLLSEAIRVGREIIPEGPITHVVDGEGKILETYNSYGKKKSYPIVVLVNGNSASASEIIAGAMQDTGAGILVGTKTYGKATVQQLENLSNQSALRFTIAKYQTPANRDIHGVGLEPDFTVELPEEYYTAARRFVGNLKPGDTGANVLFLQKALTVLGYRIQTTQTFDQATETAVRSFQSEFGLRTTGAVDQATREKLLRELERVRAGLDAQMHKAMDILLEKIQLR